MPTFHLSSALALLLALPFNPAGASPSLDATPSPGPRGAQVVPGPDGAGARPAAPRMSGAIAFLFESNRGRAPAVFDHLLQLPEGWAAVGSGELQLSARTERGWEQLSIELVGARDGLAPVREGLRGSWSNYRGNDPSAWVRAAPSAEQLRYTGVWPGIDVLYHAGPAGLRYDFCVAPGTSPATIRLRWHGVQQARVAADGRLELQTAIGALEQSAPHIFQSSGDNEEQIHGGFVIHSHVCEVLEVGFEIGAYDPSRALVIDPYFSLFGLYGGSIFDRAEAAVSDGAGTWYVAGRTSSQDFPYAEFVQGQPVSSDMYLLKINAGGIVIDTAVLAGNGIDEPYALSYREDRVALVGSSASTDMPIEGATYQAQNLGGRDVYVAVFEADAFLLDWSSYLGGDQEDQGYSVSFASNGDVLVAGETISADFPAVGPIDNGLTGADALVARFLANGSDLVWAGSYGAQTIDGAFAIVGAPDGAAWMAGGSVTGGNLQAFAVRFAANGQPDEPLYFGGSGSDRATDILLDGEGGFWLLGETSSNDFDLVGALSVGLEGPSDAFLLHRTAAGTVDFSTYLGGGGEETAIALAAGVPEFSGAAVHVLLGTGSVDLPVQNAMSAISNPTGFGTADAYVLGVGPGPDYDPIYSSYLPCADREFPRDMASDPSDRLLIVGGVVSPGGHADLPATEPNLPDEPSGASAAFLCWINNDTSALPGDVRFGSLEEVLVMGEALQIFIYRVGGATGAANVPWSVYNPTVQGFVPGLGGVVPFADGQQVAETSLSVPTGSFPDGTELYIVLEEPDGPVDVDTLFNIKTLTLLAGEAGGGGGGGGGGSSDSSSDDSDSVCALISLAGPGRGDRGLDRLRWVRDHVLSRWQGGRDFTRGYYGQSPALMQWLEPRPLVHDLLSALAFAILWLVGYAEWVLLGAALSVLVHRHRRAVRGVPARLGDPELVRALPA